MGLSVAIDWTGFGVVVEEAMAVVKVVVTAVVVLVVVMGGGRCGRSNVREPRLKQIKSRHVK